MAFDADFFVIGAGSGGVRAARIAAMNGARTIVAEESRIGGTCVIRGCVPKKLYVYASRFADDFADAAGFGWTVGPTSFDWPKLVAVKEKEISRLSDAYRRNLEASGATLIEERSTIVDSHRVRLASGREITAEHILVAVGSRPVVPDEVEGLEHTITSTELFDLPVFPRRLLVVGAGYIAVEFAALFQRLGANVTQVVRGENVLRGFDDDMRAGVRDALARAGVTHKFGVAPRRFARLPDGSLRVALTDGSELDVDQALMATGTPALYPRARPREGWRRAGRTWRSEDRRGLHHQRSLNPRDRRRNAPRRPYAGCDSRGPHPGRPAVRAGQAHDAL